MTKLTDSVKNAALFSEDGFRDLLSRFVALGYQFCRFDNPDSGEPRRIYLRHDVDISPAMALRLGEIEHENGLAANFFFQLNAETYSGLSDGTIAIIRQLRELGHCVGLHVDEHLIEPEEAAIRRTLDWFHACVTPISYAISFHRPSRGLLKKDFDGFVSAYGAEFFDPDCYFSDSRRNSEFRGQILEAAAAGRTPLQLLLHPGWWYSQEDMTAFANQLLERRNAEVLAYLAVNFSAVFGPVVRLSDDHRDAPL